MSSTVLGRIRALGRAELTLLLRNRTAVFTVALLPVCMVLFARTTMADINLAGTGLEFSGVLMTGGIATVLLMVVYASLVPAYVTRREELVLKRLRTGEAADWEIMAGTALPVVVAALVQCALLIAAGALLMDVGLPERPDLLLAGVALGLLLMVGLGAATAVFTKTVESAQVTTLPLLMVSLGGSGLFVPLDVLPDPVADGLRMLPLSPVVDLVRAGWLGGLGAFDAVRALALAVAWAALSVFAVRRWFRWEPRR
ncbi:ABC transporter permease [Streptomyces sp. TP-A0874]|uniref:ABC transporter permease n=1 Tax=Streptomyces sp. TP-A0874 TaxID=549819 RepID=UPI000853C28A|nr:ABC transporter permease [Streptomyces sp. TP-A0874]